MTYSQYLKQFMGRKGTVGGDGGFGVTRSNAFTIYEDRSLDSGLKIYHSKR